MQYVTHFTNKTKKVLAIFVDLEKAFDMVWRQGLVEQLEKYGINSFHSAYACMRNTSFHSEYAYVRSLGLPWEIPCLFIATEVIPQLNATG